MIARCADLRRSATAHSRDQILSWCRGWPGSGAVCRGPPREFVRTKNQLSCEFKMRNRGRLKVRLIPLKVAQMATAISDYIQVDERAADLGCVVPRGVVLLPANFNSATTRADFLQPSEAATVRALFRNNNIPIEDLLPEPERPRYIQNNSYEWVGPTLFISATLASENQLLVELGLHVLASYISDFFRGMTGAKTAKFAIVVERRADRTCKKINYEGDVSGISAVSDLIKQISNE